MLGAFRDYTATTKLNSSKFQIFLCARMRVRATISADSLARDEQSCQMVMKLKWAGGS
jgi:hypothetical protein